MNTFTVPTGRHVVQFRFAADSSVVLDQQLAMDQGMTLPLMQTVAWTEAMNERCWYISVRDAHGQLLLTLSFLVEKSRILPGHFNLRSRRCPATSAPDAMESMLLAFHQLPRSIRNKVLKVNVEVFGEQSERDRLSQVLEGLDFTRKSNPSAYNETAIVDLKPDVSDIMMSFHKTGRSNIRQADKHPVEIRPIANTDYIERMDSLLNEVINRTSGVVDHYDWPRVIDFVNSNPNRSILLGLFAEGIDGPDALLAYVWGRNHGDCVEYFVSAATRDSSVKLPMAYPLVWAMLKWGKECGCSWGDLGGITRASGIAGETDRLAGISGFKRYFSKDIKVVCNELEWQPNPVRLQSADVLRNVVTNIRTVPEYFQKIKR